MKRKVIIAVSLILVIAVAYIFGVEAGQFIKSSKESGYKSLRAKETPIILKKMNSVNIGDKLPNYYFYDIDGNFVELKQIINSKTLFVFFSHDCSACMDELELLNKMTSDSLVSLKLVLISDSNPFDLMRLKKHMGLPFQIIYDHGRIYNAVTRVASTPFNFIVNSDLSIEAIYPGQLFETDIQQISIEFDQDTNDKMQGGGN